MDFVPTRRLVSRKSPDAVGYIIGPRIAGYLFAGGTLAYLVLIPAIKLFGAGLTQPIFAETKLISEMSPGEVRANFVFYIGAGAVAAAGIISLIRALPTIVGAFRSGFQDLRGGLAVAASRVRTDVDLPIWVTPVGAIVLALVLTLLPQLAVNLLGAVLIVLFGFFFVVVSSRITGEIGVSANPISGMTIAALIGTTSIFLLIGWTGVDHRVGAISIAAVIAVAAGNAGATSQDLKTGFLVGATPRRQQIGIIVGAVTCAGDRLDPHAAQHHLHQHRPRAAPGRHPRGRGSRCRRPLGHQPRRANDARRARVGRHAGEPAHRRGAARQVPRRSRHPRDRLSGRSRHRRPGAGDRRPADHQARFPQGHDHGAGDRRHPHPETALGTGAARRVPHHRHRDHGAAIAPHRRRGLPADLDLGLDVRGRRGALVGGAPDAQRRAPARGSRVGSRRPLLQRAHRGRRHRASPSPASRPRW
jgi:hypothetical protein